MQPMPRLRMPRLRDAKAADAKAADAKAAAPAATHFVPEQQSSKGSVTIEGRHIDYDAYAGTLVVHPKDWDDVPECAQGRGQESAARGEHVLCRLFQDHRQGWRREGWRREGRRHGEAAGDFHLQRRPRFVHRLAAHGRLRPEARVVAADDTHTPAAPTSWSTTTTACWMPPTWCSSTRRAPASPRSLDKDAGGKGDPRTSTAWTRTAKAFTQFIKQFLTKYGRWNSPKYLFGESYGTTALGGGGQRPGERPRVDLNGVILLSPILNFEPGRGFPAGEPGRRPALRGDAAHLRRHRLVPPQAAEAAGTDLEPSCEEVEQFAMGDYLTALKAGSELPAAQKQAIAAEDAPVHRPAGGLPAEGEPARHRPRVRAAAAAGCRRDHRAPRHPLLRARRSTRCPSRPTTIRSPRPSARLSCPLFNDYVRKDLKFGQDMTYNPESDNIGNDWDFKHQGRACRSRCPSPPT